MTVITPIFFWVLFCILVGYYGRNKGIGFAGPFVISLFFSPLIGVLVVIFSRSRSKKKCLYCAEMIQKDAKICHFCGKEQPTEEIKKQEAPIPEPEYKMSDLSSQKRFYIVAAILLGSLVTFLIFISLHS